MDVITLIIIYLAVINFISFTVMGIDKKLVKLWKEKRADVVTTLKVLRELDIMKEDDVAFLTEKLDIAASANNMQGSMH